MRVGWVAGKAEQDGGSWVGGGSMLYMGAAPCCCCCCGREAAALSRGCVHSVHPQLCPNPSSLWMICNATRRPFTQFVSWCLQPGAVSMPCDAGLQTASPLSWLLPGHWWEHDHCFPPRWQRLPRRVRGERARCPRRPRTSKPRRSAERRGRLAAPRQHGCAGKDKKECSLSPYMQTISL